MSEYCEHGQQGEAAASITASTAAEAAVADDGNRAPPGSDDGVGLGVGCPMPVLRVEQLKEEGLSSTCTSEEESDSEIINRLGEFVAPTDELAAKIVAQIEFYFSDANIVKDAFLLKHVRRNKHGYVNLKLITSFKKMKALTKDFRVVAHSVRRLSDKLEVNDEGNKVRRTAPLPDYDETTPSRTVVVSNLPSADNTTVESVADLFKDCGEIALVRVLRPGKPLPPDVKKQLSKHPETGAATVALVEFEKHEGAAKAVAKATRDSSRTDWRTSLCVTPLVLPAAGSGGKQQPHGKKRPSHDASEKAPLQQLQQPNVWAAFGGIRPAASDGSLADGFSSGSEDVGPRSRGSSFSSEPRSRNNSLGGRPSPFVAAAAAAAASPSAQRRRHPHGTSPLAVGSSNAVGGGSGAGADERRTSPRPSPGGSPEMRRRHSSGAAAAAAAAAGGGGGPDGTGGGESSPAATTTSQWMQRRMAPGREISPLAKLSSPGNGGGGSPSMMRKMAHEDILIRQPKGPDGTRGFHRNGNGSVASAAGTTVAVAIDGCIATESRGAVPVGN